MRKGIAQLILTTSIIFFILNLFTYDRNDSNLGFWLRFLTFTLLIISMILRLKKKSHIPQK
ncbi:hypothetical protein SAMN04487906_0074 [Zhouia amylolytica]|uniref:Uncharacterized protein n=1 Tax=Zhouia amylolytica TaxID=376730 RepID=A0A1I6P217_9FLAO|nr:hypothetical protein SAMN04487906_0074 [Zhouia amylolytica]